MPGGMLNLLVMLNVLVSTNPELEVVTLTAALPVDIGALAQLNVSTTVHVTHLTLPMEHSNVGNKPFFQKMLTRLMLKYLFQVRRSTVDDVTPTKPIVVLLTVPMMTSMPSVMLDPPWVVDNGVSHRNQLVTEPTGTFLLNENVCLPVTNVTRQPTNVPFVLTVSGLTVTNQENVKNGNTAQNSHGGILVTVTGCVPTLVDTEHVTSNVKSITSERKSCHH
jgi:hypothetical protein